MSIKEMTVQAKLETYERAGKGYGVRISFLYTDRGPEIFHKDGFFTEGQALQWGKRIVESFVQEIPGATAQEEPCAQNA